MKWFAIVGLLLFLGVAVAPNIVGEKEELPDLVITDIGISIGPGYDPWTFYRPLFALISNIGNASTDNGFNVTIQIHRLHFGIKLGQLVFEGNAYVEELIPPGENEFDILLQDIDVPGSFLFRIYQITCEVNPDGAIIESDYSNNEHQETFINYLLFFWLP